MITVNYKEQCGEAAFCHSENGIDYVYSLELYVGNAFLVMIHNDNGNRELYSVPLSQVLYPCRVCLRGWH